jgi:DNA-binding MarR family transcriptional regulator
MTKQYNFERVEGPGRPLKPETISIMYHIMREVHRENKIPAAEIARRLGADSKQITKVGRLLKMRGHLETEKNSRGGVIYCLPAEGTENA